MFAKYIQAAMRRAKYEILEEDGAWPTNSRTTDSLAPAKSADSSFVWRRGQRPARFYGSIPELQGVWANANTLEECREELESVLEGWLLLGVSLHHAIPVIDGIEIRVPVESA